MSESEDSHEHHDEVGTTHSNYRWKGLATLLSILIGVSLPALVIMAATGYVDIESIPQAWYAPYILGWMMVMVYVLGEGTLKAVKNSEGEE